MVNLDLKDPIERNCPGRIRVDNRAGHTKHQIQTAGYNRLQSSRTIPKLNRTLIIATNKLSQNNIMNANLVKTNDSLEYKISEKKKAFESLSDMVKNMPTNDYHYNKPTEPFEFEVLTDDYQINNVQLFIFANDKAYLSFPEKAIHTNARFF